MNLEESEELYKETCARYFKWLIRIHSRRLHKPVFITWLTDKTIDESLPYDNTDKLVLTRMSRIVGAYDHRILLKYLAKHKKSLPDPVNFITWLNEVSDMEVISASDYRLEVIEQALEGAGFNKAAIYMSLDFINLFRDYADMLEDDEPYYLARTRQIDDLSKFAYDIFWQEWGHDEVPAIRIPPLITNFKLLNKRMNQMIDFFTGSIEILDRETAPVNRKRRILKPLRKGS